MRACQSSRATLRYLARRQFRVGATLALVARIERDGPRAVAVRAAKGFARMGLGVAKTVAGSCREGRHRLAAGLLDVAFGAGHDLRGCSASPAVNTTPFMAPPRPRRTRPSRRLPAADIGSLRCWTCSCPLPVPPAPNPAVELPAIMQFAQGKSGREGAAARATSHPAEFAWFEPRHNRADADRLPG